MTRWSRREALARLGWGAAGLWTLGLLPRVGIGQGQAGPHGGARRPSPARSTPPAPSRSAGPSPDAVRELAAELRTLPREAVPERVARAIPRGLDPATLLGATFLAGVLDVRPRHVGGKLHAVMVVESMFMLGKDASPETAWLVAMWNADDFKRSQARDRREGDWELPAPPARYPTRRADAERAFAGAMQAWDEEAADAALVGLLRHESGDDLYERLWPYAGRSFVNIGHKIIYAVQIERVLRRIGWTHAEPALRSLVYGLLHLDGGSREDADFEHAWEVAGRLPPAASGPPAPAARSREILAGLRPATPRQAQDLVAAAIADGVAPSAVWDGIRLMAAELFLRRPPSEAAHREALLSVHPVTVTQAFAHAARRTRHARTRHAMMLQAAAWVVALRDGLEARIGPADHGPRLDALDDATPANPDASLRLDEVLEARDPARAHRFLRHEPAAISDYQRELADHLARKGVEHHQHKYAAALFEEAGAVAPAWRPHLLAAAVTYLPTQPQATTPLAERCRRALGDAGIPRG